MQEYIPCQPCWALQWASLGCLAFLQWRKFYFFLFFSPKSFFIPKLALKVYIIVYSLLKLHGFSLFFGQILCFLFLWGHFIFGISIILLNCVALKMFTLCILHPMLQPVAKAHISKHIAIDFSLSPFFCVHKKLKYLFGICPLQWSVCDFCGLWKLIVLLRRRESDFFFMSSVRCRVPGTGRGWGFGTRGNVWIWGVGASSEMVPMWPLPLHSWNHRVAWVERDFKDNNFQPLYPGQGHLSID